MSELEYCDKCGGCERVAYDGNYYGIYDGYPHGQKKEIVEFVSSEYGVDMCKGHKSTKEKEHEPEYCDECGQQLQEIKVVCLECKQVGSRTRHMDSGEVADSEDDKLCYECGSAELEESK